MYAKDDRSPDLWSHANIQHRRIAMSLSSHLKELRRKHETLSQKVEDAQRTLSMDDLEVTKLKKQKLRLKEEIERLVHA